MLRKHVLSKLPDAPDVQDEVDSWFGNSETYLLGYMWSAVKDVWSTGHRIYGEFKGGKVLPSRTARTFLKKLVNVNKTMPLDEDLHGGSDLKHISKQVKKGKNPDEDLMRLGRERVVANVLGLASVTAVNLAQGKLKLYFLVMMANRDIACIQAVEFYFDNKYATERKIIIELASKNQFTNEDTTLLMGYIREAQSELCFPNEHLGLM